MTLVALTVTAALAGGCSRSDEGGDDPASSAAAGPSSPAPLGPFFGECGSVSDDEVRSAFAVSALPMVWRNSVGCVWEAAGPTGPSVSFSWYRGSPIGREAAGSGLIGRPAEQIEIAGHSGFMGQADGLCEIGVQYDQDFFHWSVTYGALPSLAPPCDVARKLAELTASRTK
ncbi:DUF3558 domain-containing protein [Skermania piniformis]|uniref:DUF3558 domain-containing protein n=1 Tax=Skermania pinensis TaxID=39122 RepID=A0ABX8SBX7_9ACTN|nr:DUF3558 domain-containing protein [Skermania piniformis]